MCFRQLNTKQVHTTATLPMGLTPTAWREAVAALQCLFSIKQIAAMITGLPEWNPPLLDETTNSGLLIFTLGPFSIF